MKILSMDPGKNNFACSLVDEQATILKVNYLSTVTNITIDSIIAETSKFRQSFKEFLKDCDLNRKQDYILAERLMARRGQGGGVVSECINIMLGQIIELAPVPVYLIPPSQWKNYYTKRYWDNIPNSCQKCLYRNCKACRDRTNDSVCKEYNDKLDTTVLLQHTKLSVHECDSVTIACYGFEKWHNKNKFHENLKLLENC